MLWKIRHACPQCGAPVDFSESDRLLACPYCRVRLLLHTRGVFRYVVPPKDPNRDDLLYIPYWRFKGVMYSCVPQGVKHRLLDASILAMREKVFPLSLGLRPQTLSLRFAFDSPQGRFIRPDIRLADAVTTMIRRIKSLDGTWSRKRFSRDFIGEQAGIIYAPVYEKGGRFFDAVLERPISASKDGNERKWRSENPQNWQITYLPTLCPNCGWDLAGDEDSLVLVCTNCESAWHERDGKMEKIALQAEDHPASETILPFWEFCISSQELGLGSRADLVRMANLPRIARPDEEQQRCSFLVPAFKLRPDLFLRLARQVSTSVPRSEGERAGGILPDRFFPVTLNEKEAFQSLPYIIGDLATRKKTVLPVLADADLKVHMTTLLLLPFETCGGELLHPSRAISISRQSVEHSRHI
ncbi:MAG: hypothetical protein ACOC0U_02715 [Desulfovibrionales bacterium]